MISISLPGFKDMVNPAEGDAVKADEAWAEVGVTNPNHHPTAAIHQEISWKDNSGFLDGADGGQRYDITASFTTPDANQQVDIFVVNIVPINQLINHSISQSIKEYQSLSIIIKQCQSISVNYPINQPFNHPFKQPIEQPVK